MSEETTPLTIDDTFQFACGKDAPCLNECCRDISHFLTPYDILRLKCALGVTSAEFFERYAEVHEGPESGLPVATLGIQHKPGKLCPFATASGCSVYADRPAACRTYPLARAASRNRETGVVTEYFMLVKEPHCQGFCQQETRSVRQWMQDQELIRYNRENDRLMEIISLKNQTMPGPLDERSANTFCLALYDQDSFKEMVLSGKLKAIPAGSVKKVETDDEALLILGIQWVKHELFGVPMDLSEFTEGA